MIDVLDTLKLKGNQAFAKKSFDLAVEFYSQALQMDSSNHVRRYVDLDIIQLMTRMLDLIREQISCLLAFKSV